MITNNPNLLLYAAVNNYALLHFCCSLPVCRDTCSWYSRKLGDKRAIFGGGGEPTLMAENREEAQVCVSL